MICRLLLLVFLVGICSPLLKAQTPIEAIAERQQAEERYRRLNSLVEELVAANQSLQLNMEALNKEFRKVREEVADVQSRQSQAATQETLKRLEDAIKEVDRKRVEDNRKILAELERLGKTLAAPVRNPPPSAPVKTDKVYKHTVKENDTLYGIIAAFKEQGITVSRKQIEEANPKVDWNRLQIGQEIVIPIPSR